jgi:phage I-like protein
LSALVGLSRDGRDFQAALEYAKQLARITPDDAALHALIDNLQRQIDTAPTR